MSKFRVGDRVKYIGEARPNLEGREGTILALEPNETFRVRFDAISYPEGHTPEYVNSVVEVVGTSSLEVIATPIMVKDEYNNSIPLVTEEHDGVHYQVNPNGAKMNKFRVGDRVKHIGEARIGLGNREGIIIEIEPDGDYKVALERVHFTDIDGVPTCLPSKIIHVSEYHLELANKDKKYNRQFDTGATRDVDDYKYDYEAFSTPYVMNRYAQYMHQHRIQEDGTLRDGDNWQKGIPDTAYMKSMFRHFFDVWSIMRGLTCKDPKTNESIDIEDALCGLKFNVDGLLFNILKKKNPVMYNGVKLFGENNGT